MIDLIKSIEPVCYIVPTDPKIKKKQILIERVEIELFYYSYLQSKILNKKITNKRHQFC